VVDYDIRCESCFESWYDGRLIEVVTVEDVQTLKNDWLTDNVRVYHNHRIRVLILRADDSVLGRVRSL
jgi:hypothetical protein